jgi:transcriptional regulator with XRE-family HTH domain
MTVEKRRSDGLPADLRAEMAGARERLGLTQAELGRRVGLPQMHISAIETGKVVPRFDTLRELVRVLGYDLLLVRRELVPVVQAMSRRGGAAGDEERPLYEPDEEDS